MTTTIGRYQVVRHIGRGGMADVFECKRTGIGGFDKTVVIKRILPELLEDRQFVDMFLDEARLVAYLNHPNVVHVYEIDEADGVPYIVMEYVRGVSLRQVVRSAMKRGLLRVPMMAKLMSGAALGLDHAHNAADDKGEPLGIIHRDVTPHNILVSYDGVSKLADFGVAKGKGRIAMTEAGLIKGKISYVAPEYLHHNMVDARSDVYMTGVTLYEATVGQSPFRADNEAALLKAIMKYDFVKPTSIAPTYPPALEKIVLWATHPTPAERCPSARALSDALEKLCAAEAPPVTQEAVAAWLKELFPEDERNREAADAGRTSTSADGDITRRTPVSSSIRYPGLSGSPSGVMSTQASVTPLPTTRKGWLTLGVGVVALVALAGAIGAAVVLTASGDGPPPAPAPAPDRAASITVLLDEADKLAQARQYAAALEVLGKAGEMHTSEPQVAIRLATLVNTVEKQSHLAQAQRAMESGEWEVAITNAKEVLDRDSGHEEAIRLLRAARAKLEGNDEERPEGGKVARPRRAKRTSRDNQAPGRVTITTTPPATIYVDDDLVGPSPVAALSLPPGVHVIEARTGGHQPVVKNITLRSGQSLPVSLTLESIPSAAPAPPPPPPARIEAPAAPKADSAPPEKEKKSATVEAPRLPPTYAIANKKDLVRTFDIIEKEICGRGSVDGAQCRNSTAPLAKELLEELSPGSTVEVFPRAMYYFVVDAAAAGRPVGDIAEALRRAHRSGELRAKAER